ncbi:MAG TPA: mechanosensitive ion channel domain-containing protein, partial [Burkholderiaceae bacterium]|nr:mechanosensitive ion channel domain-containing protein [Burkholderiaceae bacterium]
MTSAPGGIVRPLTPGELNAIGHALFTSEALVELGVLTGCAVLAYVLTGLILRAIGGQARSTSVLFGEKLFDGALFPWLMFGLAVAARRLVLDDMAPVLARPGLPLLLSLAVIRLAVRVLRAAFPRSSGVRLVERRVSWIAWIGVVLWLTGVLPIVLAELDEIGWKLGTVRITLGALVEGLFNAVIVLMFVVWASALIENKLIGSRTDNLSLRKMASNASRSLLFFAGLLVALSAAGIDLTAVSVFGGAIGVGLGLGLQKLASNYVSGFVILAERSLHIGDVVKVDNFE